MGKWQLPQREMQLAFLPMTPGNATPDWRIAPLCFEDRHTSDSIPAVVSYTTPMGFGSHLPSYRDQPLVRVEPSAGELCSRTCDGPAAGPS